MMPAAMTAATALPAFSTSSNEAMMTCAPCGFASSFTVTEVAVKLLAKPQGAQVIMASFDDVEKAGNAVAAVIAAGIIPAGLEMMDRPATRAVEQVVAAGSDGEER